MALKCKNREIRLSISIKTVFLREILTSFGAAIAKNMNADNPYSDEMFLVIDDPLSSFDYENKIGIMSFLKFKMNYK